MDNSRYIEEIFLSEDDLVEKGTKTRTLNIIMDRIKIIESTLEDDVIQTQLNTLKSLIEDAYNISMYKFQFKVFTFSLNKEIENIEKILSYG